MGRRERRPISLCAPIPGRAARNATARRADLDLSDDVLQFLGDLEDRNPAGGNGNRLARPGIPREARLPILHLEGSEAPDLDVLAGCERSGNRLEKLVDRVGDVLLGQAGSLGNLVDAICLGHQLLLASSPASRMRRSRRERRGSVTTAARAVSEAWHGT